MVINSAISTKSLGNSMAPNILLFGATSILGYTLAKRFSGTVIPFTSPGNFSPSIRDWPILQLENSQWIDQVLTQYEPALLLYSHAVCDVPKCETDPTWAYEVNVGNLQRVLKALPAHTRLVYVSSDHVFGEDGTYDERSVPCPISVYGRTRVEAERLVLKRADSLVVRTGLAIGPSPNGRTGHLDWLRYRKQRQLPITIVKDEYRSVVWVEDLARRVMALVASKETGLRHVAATRAVSRIELAEYLLKRLGLRTDFRSEGRHQRPTPHIGHVELTTTYEDELSQPLPSVLDSQKTTLLREIA